MTKKLSEKAAKISQRARFITLEQILDLTENLWFTTDASIRHKWLYKAASIVYVFTYLSGRRVIDVLRLRWEDLEWIKNPNGQFLQFQVRHSKSNVTRPDFLTCFVVDSEPNLNIRRRLAIWWQLREKPENGFIIYPEG